MKIDQAMLAQLCQLAQQAGAEVMAVYGTNFSTELRPGWLNPEFVAWGDAACAPLCRSLLTDS